MALFFDQEANTQLPSIDEVQTDRVIADVNANHQRHINELSQAKAEVVKPTNPSWLKRNIGNIAAWGVGLAIFGGVVELGLEAADHQATKAAQTNEEMVQQQQMLDDEQPLSYDIEP